MNSNTQEIISFLSESENKILQSINEFRENPIKFADKKDYIRKRQISEYLNFINALEKMSKLKPDKELCNIAKEEVIKLSDDMEYNKYQIGKDLEAKLNNKFSKNETGLIAIDDINKIELLIPKIIINNSDRNKKGRDILINKEYTHVGCSHLEKEYGNFIILIFSKIKAEYVLEKKDEIKFIKDCKKISYLNKEDLFHFVENVTKSIDNELYNNYKSFLETLTLIYYEYNQLIKNDEFIQNFHGNIDFYYLIKCAIIELKNLGKEINELNKDKIFINIGIKSLIKNFGGSKSSLENIKSIFKKYFLNYKEEENYNNIIIESIKNNINDYNYRPLMIITNTKSIKYYIENLLNSENKNYKVIIGSEFHLDKNDSEKKENYKENILNKIKLLLHEDIILILNNTEFIFPYIYDLFLEVDSNFRLIALITKNQLDKIKSNFHAFNFFEKHILNFRNILDEKQMNLAKKISDNLSRIKTFNKKDTNFAYDLSQLVINCENDEIEGLIYEISKENFEKAKDEEFIEEEILKKIVPNFCQDIIASVKFSGFNEGKSMAFAEKIIKLYNEKEIYNFDKFIEKVKKHKNIIYTFSPIFNFVIPEGYTDIKVEEIDSENKAEEIIINFFENKFKYLIFRFNEKDVNKMYHIDYLINKYENKSNNKIIIFLFHLSRAKKNKKIDYFYKNEGISYLDNSYEQFFIDNLNNEKNDFLNILNIKEKTKLINSIIDYDNFFDQILGNAMSIFDFKLIDKYSRIKENNYSEIVVHKLIYEKDNINNKLLRDYLIEYSIKKLDKKNIILYAFLSKNFQNASTDFFQLLENSLLSELCYSLSKIINYIIKKGELFSSILIKENNTEIIQNELILKQIKNFFECLAPEFLSLLRRKLRSNKVNIVSELSIPFSYNLFNAFKKNYHTKDIIEKYILNENFYLSNKNNNFEKDKFDKYLFEYNKMVEAIKNKFTEIKNINDIFMSNQENLKKCLLFDYLSIYCAEISNKFLNINEQITNPINFIILLLNIKFIMIEENSYLENKIDLNIIINEAKNNVNLLNLSKIFLFLESYKDDATFVIEAFCLLNYYFPSLEEQIKQIIKLKIIKQEKENININSYYLKNICEIFYILIGALLKTIYLNIEGIYSMETNKFHSFFDSLKYIIDNFDKIYQKFLLSKTELYSLINLLSLYEIFKNESDVKDIMINIMKIIGKESEYLINKNYNKLISGIVTIKNIIAKKFGDNSNILADYLTNILRQQFKITDDENYKYEIIKLVFESERLIERAGFFISETIKIKFPILLEKNDNIDINNNFSFYTKEECEQYFLNFISEKKTDKFLIFYENIKSEIFNHVILYYFELLVNEYFKTIFDKYKYNINNNIDFKSKEECEDLLLNQNLLFLKKALNHIDNVMENKNIDPSNLNNLGKLYSIAYIKLYMKYFAEICFYCRDKISFKFIEEIICSKESNSRKVVIIFFFKNIFQYFENYSNFNSFFNNKENENIPFKTEYKELSETHLKNSLSNYILNENFLSLKNFEEKYNKNLSSFIYTKNNNFEDLNTLINEEFIKNDGIDIFFCFLINHLISYYFSSEKDEYLKKIELFKLKFKKISANLGLPKDCLNLLDIIINIKEFINTLITKYNDNNYCTQEQFEIVMNSLRFVLQSSQYNENNFYKNLLSSQCKNNIDKNYIPGTLPYNNMFINTYYILNELLRIQDERTAYYVCTCGQYYTIGNCLSPYTIYSCFNQNCKLKIGGEQHKLLGAEAGQTDHYLVILEEKDRKKTYWLDKDTNDGKIPYICLSEYKKRYVDKYLNKQTKGIIKEDIDFFLNRKIKVRNLDELSFRLLNYILYSHLFYANLLGYISDEEIRIYTYGEFNCIKLIEKNYEIIKNILKEKGINNIKSFMNVIFDKINELMRNIGDMSTIEKREEFENCIKTYLEKLINNKNIYYEEEIKYNKFNEKIKQTNPNNLNEIISENYSPLIYDFNEYPNLFFFLLSKYPDFSDMKLNLNKTINNNKYFLINEILKNDDNFEALRLMKNVIDINKLVNMLYIKYNNKIERDKAKMMEIIECFDKSENIENIKKDILIPYINSWNKIKSKCTNYLCWPTMPILDITMKHTLNYYLPDDGELYGGLYLTSAYRFFIETQNKFIKKVIESIDTNSLLKKYLSQLNQKIYIQDANENDIIKINSDTKKLLDEMNLKYSIRDIFQNGKINFKKFKTSIKYDFDSIEKDLAKKILSRVKQLISEESKQPIKYISYIYESFRSNRSQTIIDYIDKYPQRNLTKEEEKIFYDFIKKNKNFKKNILSSCIILINYIQKENFENNKSILSVIKELPNYIEINNNLKDFFIENTNNKDDFQIFTINSLINIYEIIELLCWDEFKRNLNDKYKMPINEEIKIKIKNFINATIKEENLIKMQDIANAIRKLISRYLCGKRSDTDINELIKLTLFLSKTDLWKYGSFDNDNFEEELMIFIEKIDKIKFVMKCNDKCDKCKKEHWNCVRCDECNCGLRIGQALEFYELIINEILEQDNNGIIQIQNVEKKDGQEENFISNSDDEDLGEI